MPRISRTIDATASGTFDIDGLNETTPHTQIGIIFLNSDVPTTPNAGTFSISVKPQGSSTFELIQLGEDIDATAPINVITYSAIGDELKYEPTGVTGVDEVQITLSSTGA